jgi:PIN domain nuclease of toxin-antitoxin system
MNLLLDTCTFLWLSVQPDKLSRAAVEAIENPENVLFLSDTSVWEVVIKFGVGKLPLPESPRVWIPKQAAFFRLQNLPISTEAILRCGELPRVHNDPFDRLIAAQAVAGDFPLISPDPPFRAFSVKCIW